MSVRMVASPSESPEGPDWSQHRIASTNQHPISMDSKETTVYRQVYGQRGVGWELEKCARKREMVPKNDVAVAVPLKSENAMVHLMSTLTIEATHLVGGRSCNAGSSSCIGAASAARDVMATSSMT